MLDFVAGAVNKGLGIFGFQITRNQPKPALPARYAQRFLLFSDMFRELADVEGCIVECGVAYGRGLLFMSYLAQHEGKQRHLYGYDTFAGYPSVSPMDMPKDGAFLPPEVGGLAVPIEETQRVMRESKIGDDFLDTYVHLVKGDVAETTKHHAGGKIALLVTEMDLYSGSKAALENLLPHMAPGGIVLPLNYWHAQTKFPGGHKAVEEIFGDRVKDFRVNQQTGKRYYVQPRG